MFYAESPENEEKDLVMEIENRPPAMHKLPPTVPFHTSSLKRAAAEAENALAEKSRRMDDPEQSNEIDNGTLTQSPESQLDTEEYSIGELEFTVEEIEQLLASPEDVIVELWVVPDKMQNESPEVTPEYKRNVLPFSRNLAEDLRLPRSIDGRYMIELERMVCYSASDFTDKMFLTRYGRMVLLVRPWENKMWNLNTSFDLCRISYQYEYDAESQQMRLYVDDLYIAQATASSSKAAKAKVALLAWDILQREAITIITKDSAISYDQIVTVDDLITRPNDVFTKWLKNSPPKNLGANMDGVVEQISPNVRVVIRKGAACPDFTLEKWKAAFIILLERYLVGDTMDMDLVFNSDFNDEERHMMHWTARGLGLSVRKIVSEDRRCIIIKRKFDPFTIARRVLAKGGETPKYQAFMPLGVRVE